MNFNYLRQIAQAADQLGYYGVLLPTGRSCEDSWVVASAVAPLTERLRYLVAVRPGLQSPSVAARMTATLDRVSNGRLLVNVVTGGDPVENKGDGIFLDHDERYAVTREFLDVYRALLEGETSSPGQAHPHRGWQAAVSAGATPRPPLYFGGSSDAGIDVAVDTVDKYLTWGEPPAQVAEKINRVECRRSRARPQGLVRHPPACDRARNQRGSMAGGGRPDPMSPTRRSRQRSRYSRGWIQSASSAWRSCTAAAGTSSKSARISGQVSDSCAAARERRWSAIPNGRCADPGISGRRHRYLHHVRLPAS